MLANMNALATIAVRDIEVARDFYETKLGLRRMDSGEPSVLMFKSGNSDVMVYESRNAGTNKATSATWVVGAKVDEIARGLAERGVKFERYDMPDTTHEGDVHVSGKIRVAWFTDPDGNILSIVNG